VSTVVNRQKLRSIRDLPPSPCVPAAKLLCARRLPEDRCQTTSRGAHEIPLLSPEVSGTCDESHPLAETAGVEMKHPAPSNTVELTLWISMSRREGTEVGRHALFSYSAAAVASKG